MKKAVRIIFLVIFLIPIIYFIYDFLFVYHLKMNGKEEITIDVNSNYQELGATLKYRGKEKNDYVIDSNLDTKKVGSYYVKYKKGKKTVTRKVNVKDLDNPSIELLGDSIINLTYNNEYVEPGYKANDNYDGDITDKVIVNSTINNKELGEYEVDYKVSDSNKNEIEVKRIIKVVDDVKPVIKIKSKENDYLILGKKIKLNDYTAKDNYDGDITNKVKINGKVNNKKQGVYKIKYSVKDSSDNETILEKIINVQEKNTLGIPVLMYHWFYDDTKGEKPGNVNTHNYISKTELTKQVKYLKENNYYFPSWKELIDYIDGKIDLPKKSVIVTDDDCVNSFFKVALPVFQKYEVPVTSFCITNKNNWKKYTQEKYLDFESHTNAMHERRCKNWTGAYMCSSYKEIYDDLILSIKKVKNKYAFAYPFGHHSESSIKALKDSGIKLAFTINSGRVRKGNNKYLLPRVRISKGTTINQFKNLVR